MRIRSRIICPISRPPIENGGLFVSNGLIAEVGDWNHINRVGSGEAVDLGDSVVLPGLINAHCHLDYSDMAGKILPTKCFPDWIKSILALKAGWSFSEYAASWLHGSEMLVRTGTTTVGDIEAVPELIPDLWTSTPLRVISYLEMTGVKSDRSARRILAEAVQKLQSLPKGRNDSGLSPHALYSTKPELLKLTAEATAAANLPVAMHVAESLEEFQMFFRGHGALYDWLKNQRDMSDCGNTTPVQRVAESGLMDAPFLAVHVNYLGSRDAELLARKNASVVHCPSSHAYFEHCPFPFGELTKAGVNVCLGTDSLASCKPEPRGKPELNMFLEMRRFHQTFPTVSAEEILRLCTLNAAKALHRVGLIGEISRGAYADFIALPFGGQRKEVFEQIIQYKGPVAESWIDGKKIFATNR